MRPGQGEGEMSQQWGRHGDPCLGNMPLASLCLEHYRTMTSRGKHGGGRLWPSKYNRVWMSKRLGMD